MKTFRAGLSNHWLPAGLGLLLVLGLVPDVYASGSVASKTKGARKTLAVSFPTPADNSSPPQLLVIPLLGGGRSLLPGGKLLVWVGRSDGTALADVRVVVRAPNPNPLASAGSRVETVTVRTDADGLATAFFAAPEVPKPPGVVSGGDDDGDDDDGDNGGGPPPP